MELNLTPKQRKIHIAPKRSNNTSGIVGVGRYVSRERGRQGFIERISWQAFWDGPDGKRHGRKFSVNIHGERRARELARRARDDAMRTIFNWASLPADHTHAESG